MTCQSCRSSVTKAIESVQGVQSIKIDLQNNTAEIEMNHHISLKKFQEVLDDKYSIAAIQSSKESFLTDNENEKSKLAQLKPLFLILLYIGVASVLMHKDNLNMIEIMQDFMGLFFIVFSFFKILDIKSFALSFSMYDPLAKLLPSYSKIYPFIETIIGIMFLFKSQITIALFSTIIILGLTTIGVTKTLLSKRSIKCACLGTALDLPMTEATFIENALMIIMSFILLLAHLF
jgi:copper chaperone CopZ